MRLLLIAVGTLAAVAGCSETNNGRIAPAAVANASESAEQPKRRARQDKLSVVRRGFKTTLVRRESSGEPLPEPPSEIFVKIQYDAAPGPLGAYLSPDPKDGRKHPAIVWITGGDTSTIDDALWSDAHESNDQTARQFRQAGIVMMFPTQRGGNQNPGVHEGLFGEIDDIVAAAEFLAQQPHVDPQRIYLGGHSSGGTAALLAAEMSNRFRAVIAISPSDDMRTFPEFFQVFEGSDLREFAVRSPGLWLESIEAPTFVFAGARGDGALKHSRNMAKMSTNPQLRFVEVSGADHFNLVAPINRLAAQKILQDVGPQCNLSFTTQEVDAAFAQAASARTKQSSE